MASICWGYADHGRITIRCLALALTAASLAACAQSAVVTQRSASFGTTTRVARLHDHRLATTEQVSVARKHDPYRSEKTAARKHFIPHGVASFYSEDTETASGEKFNPRELTAAHPTLPFGTRLRVTNMANGHSVTVRVNDRGPFVSGRVVDVSHSAAEALGMARSGTANVKLDVVE
jgi:rare lipoprotein A